MNTPAAQAKYLAPSLGLPAVAVAQPRLLILGSLPGVASLRAQQYYGHPRNGFWPIMQAWLGWASLPSYLERCQALQAQGVVLWDVLKQGVRQGSLDSAIQQQGLMVNDFTELLSAPSLQGLLLNGQKAGQLWQRACRQGLIRPPSTLSLQVLPSTSPAHASLRQADKQAKWLAALPAPLAATGQHGH